MTNLTGKDPIASASHEKGFVEFVRSSAYTDLTAIAKTFGKRPQNWMRLQGTKDLIKAFEEDPSYGEMPPIITAVGRNLAGSDLSYLKLWGVKNPKQGTWAHPDIAIQFAQWCSPRFALWVSRQIRHLLTYGEVNVNYREWTEEQFLSGVELNRDDIKDLYS